MSRIEKALRECSFPLAHEYLTEMNKALTNRDHELQATETLPHFFNKNPYGELRPSSSGQSSGSSTEISQSSEEKEVKREPTADDEADSEDERTTGAIPLAPASGVGSSDTPGRGLERRGSSHLYLDYQAQNDEEEEDGFISDWKPLPRNSEDDEIASDWRSFRVPDEKSQETQSTEAVVINSPPPSPRRPVVLDEKLSEISGEFSAPDHSLSASPRSPQLPFKNSYKATTGAGLTGAGIIAGGICLALLASNPVGWAALGIGAFIFFASLIKGLSLRYQHQPEANSETTPV